MKVFTENFIKVIVRSETLATHCKTTNFWVILLKQMIQK